MNPLIVVGIVLVAVALYAAVRLLIVWAERQPYEEDL